MDTFYHFLLQINEIELKFGRKLLPFIGIKLEENLKFVLLIFFLFTCNVCKFRWQYTFENQIPKIATISTLLKKLVPDI